MTCPSAEDWSRNGGTSYRRGKTCGHCPVLDWLFLCLCVLASILKYTFTRGTALSEDHTLLPSTALGIADYDLLDLTSQRSNPNPSDLIDGYRTCSV